MATLHRTRIDIPEEQRTRLVDLLNARLADTLDLASQVKYAHWNVKGNDFFQLHELFDELAGSLREFADTIAERAAALGGRADGTLRQAAERSTIPEYPTDVVDGADHVAALADRYAAYAAAVRQAADEAEKLGDMATNDLFIEVARTVDKHLWFLEAHLQA
ncbi:MAG: DNA starvation/stationary phase protection protein [Acidimicrobiia bacterium]|nr:MAG: DNA starvation/stationary phase protection protein [Acidimicrobiia bacterium]